MAAHSHLSTIIEVCTCQIKGGPFERNGHTASCNRETRKSLTDSQKAEQKKAAKPKRIDKVGTNNTFKCSDGERVNQSTINAMRSRAYDIQAISLERDSDICQGCGGQAEGHAHIIPQARCKVIGKTELIWDSDNIFMSCHRCNAIAENVSSIGITKLKNFQRIKAILELHDPERFAKLCYTENEIHKI